MIVHTYSRSGLRLHWDTNVNTHQYVRCEDPNCKYMTIDQSVWDTVKVMANDPYKDWDISKFEDFNDLLNKVLGETQ